jgi:antitoxin PrlF
VGWTGTSFLTKLKKVRNPGIFTVTTDATLTSKGQTTIPKEIRDSLNMKAGDRMTFTLLPDGTVLLRLKNKSILDLAGRLHKKGRKALPVEDLSR